MKIALVIPVWNDPKGLVRLLVKAQELAWVSQIVVADDASDPPCGPGMAGLPAAVAADPRLLWLRSDTRHGPGHGRNHGLGPVCIHLNQSRAETRKTKPMKLGMVFSQRDASEALDPLEEVFDLVAFGVEVCVEGWLDRAGWIGLDMGLCPEVIPDLPAQGARVVGRISDDMADTVEPVDQGRGLRAVAALTRCRDQPNRQPERIHGGMDLGRQAATRTPDPVSLSPPLPPVASAWALQIVLLMRTYSKSGSALNSLKRRSQTPAIAQRRKRACAPVHLSNSGGRSRHGAAVRASHSTASTNRRLSAPLRPGNPSRPGRCPSIRAHCASVNVRLLKIASVFDLESELKSHGNPLNADRA